MPEHRKCRILANGSMQPIKLKGVAQAVFSENLLDIVDLFLYIKMSWLLKTGLYLALDLPQGGGGERLVLKYFFVLIIPPSKITHITGNILVKPHISSSCILIK